MKPASRPCQKTGRHAGRPYRKAQKAYATDFGVSLATVKRWWRKGLPCDDADAMGEFLSPRGRKPDDDFEEPSIVPLPEYAAFPAAPAGGDSSPEPETPVRLAEDFFAGSGFLAEIAAMQTAAKERRASYFVAVTTRQKSATIRNRLSDWMLVVEALRKVEKDLPGIHKANNQAVDRAELEVVIGQIFLAFRTQVTVAFSQLIEKLGLGDDPDAHDHATTAADRLLRSLSDLNDLLPGGSPDGSKPAAADV